MQNHRDQPLAGDIPLRFPVPRPDTRQYHPRSSRGLGSSRSEVENPNALRAPPEAPLKMLLIEDDASDARLFHEILRTAGRPFEIIHAQSIGDAEKYFSDVSIDCIVVDMHLPDLSGLEALAAVHAGSAGQPILVLTGRGEIATGIDAVRLGAQDYLFKDDLNATNLLRAILYAIERQRLLACMRDSVRYSATSEENVRRLMFKSAEAMGVVGEGGQVYFGNQLAEELFGKTSLELLTSPFELSSAPGTETEHEIARADGSRITAEARAVHVLWQERSAVLISLRDVSERRRAVEQQLRFDLLTNFLNHMSHEVRTPLAAIYQFVSNVRDGILGPVNPGQSEQLGRALRNVDDMLTMISNLLDVARTHAFKLRIEPRIIELEAEVQPVLEVLRAAARESHIDFVIVWPERLPRVLADPVRVRQIVASLTENAIKFTPAGGTVTVSVRANPATERVLLTVEDTGCGVPSAHLSRIFDELHQVPDAEYRTRQGLGLGLFITRELMRGLGGEIQVSSAPGRGSSFEIALPMFTFERLLKEAEPAAGIWSGPVIALFARLSWAWGLTDEPVPAAAVTQLRTLLTDVVAQRAHALIPPQVDGGGVSSGVVVFGCEGATDDMCRDLEARAVSQELFRDSALQVVFEGEELLAGGEARPTVEVARILETHYDHSNRRGKPCETQR